MNSSHKPGQSPTPTRQAFSSPDNFLLNLLDKKINIPKGIRGIASDSQTSLRDFLANERKRDDSFPRILSIKDSDFIGGSFGRHTKVKPLDDIDIYVPLDGHYLTYIQNGQTAPYIVQSDGALKQNPLLTPKWMSGNYISSSKLIDNFAAVLSRHYSQSDVNPDGKAVTVRLTHGASEESDGLGYDIVPSFSLKPTNAGGQYIYVIPDGNGSWTHTNPRIDEKITNALHKDNNKLFRKSVRLIKHWNATRIDSAILSYYIELAIARRFMELNQTRKTVTSLSNGVALGLIGLSSALNAGNLSSWVKTAPPVEPGQNVNEEIKRLVAKTANQALAACTMDLRGNREEAIKTWEEIFAA